MIFEGRRPSELSPTDIRSILGRREDIEIDFKQVAYSQTGKPENEWKLSLLKDVTAMANTNGGYLFIGVEETTTKQAHQFLNINNAQGIAKSMHGICLHYIYEKLVEDELTIEPYTVNDKKIIIARILPGGNKPYMITYNDNTLFYMRCDNGHEGFNRAMTVKEIRDAFLKDAVLLGLNVIDKKMDHIIRTLGDFHEQ